MIYETSSQEKVSKHPQRTRVKRRLISKPKGTPTNYYQNMVTVDRSDRHYTSINNAVAGKPERTMHNKATCRS
jgi:hypothetical protein